MLKQHLLFSKNALDTNGMAALHWSVGSGYLELSNYIVSIGINATIVDSENENVFEITKTCLDDEALRVQSTY